MRRLSKASSHDLNTPTRTSFNQDSIDINILSSGGAAGAGPGIGMGNLADELADAFSDSGDEYGDVLTSHEHNGGDATQDSDLQRSGQSNPQTDSLPRDNLNLPSPHRKGHQKKNSHYDGSEYGSDSDLDTTGLSPSLISKIDSVESLARRGTENYGGDGDDVFKRVTEELRDLGSQSSVEASASR
jgi:hypothetical protein